MFSPPWHSQAEPAADATGEVRVLSKFRHPNLVLLLGFSRQELRKIGRLAGLDNAELDACLQDGEKAQSLVAWWEENQKADDINSTPSFIINGKKYSNMPYAEMKEIIDAALEE